MKRILILLMVCFVGNQISAKPLSKSDSLNTLYQKNIELSNELAKTNLEIEYTKSLVQTGNGTISNQLSSSQYTLSTLSTLFTIIGIILAVAIPLGTWYVSRLANQVTDKLATANEILITIKNLKSEVQKIETEVNTTKELIQNNLSLLYQSLQDEEIKAIFDRLRKEPIDIQHSFTRLATIHLPEKYFVNLKDIYLKVENKHQRAAFTALILLTQHFSKQCFDDKDMINELKKYFICDSLYLSELPDYNNALCDFVGRCDINDHILLFENALNGVIYRGDNDVYNATEIVLRIWNDRLNNEQKDIIIKLIGISDSLNSFRSLISNWNELLTITY